jgi:hypothetical protein
MQGMVISEIGEKPKLFVVICFNIETFEPLKKFLFLLQVA